MNVCQMIFGILPFLARHFLSGHSWCQVRTVHTVGCIDDGKKSMIFSCDYYNLQILII